MAKTSPLVSDLAHHLRARILSGEFPPDAAVTESGLAAEYGVARPTARSAVDVLVAEGLLLRSPFAAVRVTTVSEHDLPEVLALLDVCEGAAVERIRQEDPDLRELRRLPTADLTVFLDGVVRAAQSPRLEAVHRRATFDLLMYGVQHHVQVPAPPSEAAVRELSDALLTGRFAAADASLAHLQQHRRTVLLPQPATAS